MNIEKILRAKDSSGNHKFVFEIFSVNTHNEDFENQNGEDNQCTQIAHRNEIHPNAAGENSFLFHVSRKGVARSDY